MEESEDKQAIKQAIDTIVENFSKHANLHGHGKINIIDALEEFWNMKINSIKSNIDAPLIVYEFLETPGPPYVCFATLPGGACFATFQVISSKFIF
jgi:LIX1-like protein